MAFSAAYLSSNLTKLNFCPFGEKTLSMAPKGEKAALRASSSVHPRTKHGFRCTGLFSEEGEGESGRGEVGSVRSRSASRARERKRGRRRPRWLR